MEGYSLLASAAMNIGVALILLSLFSIFSKQPSKATVYYARRIVVKMNLPFDDTRSFYRYVPSFSSITSSLHVSEDDILEFSGLDALIMIKLLKFGIRFFLVCSVVGMLVLLPLNYFAGERRSSSTFHSMDVFTISNIGKGSNWLWVHCVCLYFISGYGVYLLHKEYGDILNRRLHQLHILRHQPNQFTVLVREIPLCDEHKARDCAVDHFFSKYHPHSYQSYQILYDSKDLDKLVKQAKSVSRKIEDLRQSMVRKQRKNFRKLDGEMDQLKQFLEELSHRIRHMQSKDVLKSKELPVALVTFKSRWGASLAAQSQQTSNPLVWITEMAPEPRDVLWNNLAVPMKWIPLYKFGIYIAVTFFTIFFAVPVTAVQGIAKFERLKQWFPPAMAVDLIPGLSSIVTGYIPSVILNGFIYVVPFAMIQVAKWAGYVSRSKKDIRACNMVFYFLIANVFFLTLFTGSLLDHIGESFIHPKDFPSRLASAVSAQGDFFMTYILTNGLCGFSLEILQPGLLTLDALRSNIWARGKKRTPYLYSLPYYRTVPFISLVVLIGMVYAVVSPLILPFLVGYFCLGYVVFVNQIQDVYITTYETCGQYWPYIHHYIIVALIIMQISMIGLFGLKSKPAASFSTIPLLIFTILFNEYCKVRFLPTFSKCSVKDARDRDDHDQKTDLLEANLENAIDAYSPPCLRPADIEDAESSSLEPLISHTAP